jgi:hypothetical protein
VADFYYIADYKRIFAIVSLHEMQFNVPSRIPVLEGNIDWRILNIDKPNNRRNTMIPEKLQEIMKKDGVVAIATLGPDGPHMVNTWNSYLRISQDERLFIPAGYMNKTEANIAYNPNVLITLGSSKVEGLHGAGAGFLIKGKARFVTSGPDFDFMKEKFSWLRATLAVTIESAIQTW